MTGQSPQIVQYLERQLENWLCGIIPEKINESYLDEKDLDFNQDAGSVVQWRRREQRQIGNWLLSSIAVPCRHLAN
jgi:hypothetical protein